MSHPKLFIILIYQGLFKHQLKVVFDYFIILNYNLIMITKNNYKQFGIKNWKAFRMYKKTLLNNPIVFNKYYKPVKSSIYNRINMSVQGGKSKNARYNHSL